MKLEGFTVDSDYIKYYKPVGCNLIEEFEKKYQVELPLHYKEFIQTYGEARLEENEFKYWNAYRKENSSTDFYFLDFKEYVLYQDFDVYGHDKVYMFAETAGGDYICFDYRSYPNIKEPSIVILNHEELDENDKFQLSFVANNFDELGELFIDYKNKYDESDERKPTGIFFHNLEIFSSYGNATTQDIQKFEEKYQIVLPSLYKEFMQQYNMAEVLNGVYRFTDFYGKKRVNYCLFLGFGDCLLSINDKDFQKVDETQSFGHKGLIAFGKTYDRCLICFDYRQNLNPNTPEIVHLDTDLFEQGRYVVSKIANSFEDFINLLEYR